ncbi:MAG: glycosyltransferase family 9 protein [Candidatus Omnitrophota bacterium]
MLDKSRIKKILFITLSNIGDVILTLPVLDVLASTFPGAHITVLVGGRPSDIFYAKSNISVIIFNKQSLLSEKINLLQRLRKERFDLVVDLRNTSLGILLMSRYHTSPFLKIPNSIVHMKDRHMYRLESILGVTAQMPARKHFDISAKDYDYIESTLSENKVRPTDKIIVISPGARSHIKRWKKFGFINLINRLIENSNQKVVLVGDEFDAELCIDIANKVDKRILNLCNKTTLNKLACLIKKAKLVITNDSAVMHLASYLDASVLAIFGPTDPAKYGPWAKTKSVIRNKINCSPCEKGDCKLAHECMNLITPQEVFVAARKFLEA